MQWDFLFFVNSTFLGVGLAMDAFSVSLANGLNEPRMKSGKMCAIAGVFALFQALMPMLGWVCVHTIVRSYRMMERFVPWIALLLLGYIGGKMLSEGLRHKEGDEPRPAVGFGMLIMQGIATSIDALSVGFTIADYGALMALVCSLIIAAVTFCICLCGLILGRKFGTRLASKAGVLGGVILLIIGVEIFVSGVF